MAFLLKNYNKIYEYLSKEIQKCSTFYKIIHCVSLSALIWIIMGFYNLAICAGMQDNLEKAFRVLGISNNLTKAGNERGIIGLKISVFSS